MPDASHNDELVQRFVDQELSAEERIRFVVALARDEALRQCALELEHLVVTAARLPRPSVPDGFVGQVLVRAGAGQGRDRHPVWSRVIDALWAPRAFRWNLAGAAAAFLMVFVAGTLLIPALRPQPPVRNGAGSATAESPIPHPVLVRLVVVQPGARVVQAAGDFNGWNPARTPLEQTVNGAWTVTLPLDPGRYEYQFVVDGERWIADPFAIEQSDDGFGSQNAVLDVRAPTERPL